MFNWSFIILAAFRILKVKITGKLLALFGQALILAAVSGTLIDENIRFGFFVSVMFAAIIGLVAIIMQKKVWKKG